MIRLCQGGSGWSNLLYGGDGNDSITGNLNAGDSIFGGSGNDTITGATGADRFTGGTGNDYFRFTAYADSTTAERDTIFDFTSGDIINLHNMFYDGFGTDEDKLTATFDGTNTIVTAKTAIGGTTFSFQLSGDVTALIINANLVYAAGIQGTAGNDTLTATTDGQGIYGGSGNDNISRGGFFNNTIHGGDGNDTISTGGFGSIAYGGAGDDSISDQNFNGIVFGGDGNDTIVSAGAGWDKTLYGGSGNDSITGNASANDAIFGGSGADTITGDTGADNISLGAADTAVDRVIFRATNDGASGGANTGQDTIAEFEVGTDKIAFTSTVNTNFDDIGLDDTFAWVTNAAANFATTHEAMLITGLTNANLTQSGFTAILTALNGYGITAANGNDAIIVAQGTSQTAFFLYTENGTLANNIVSGELTLLGVTNGQLTTSDFIFA